MSSIISKKAQTINALRTAIENRKTRSAWDRGVIQYALELVDSLEEIVEYAPEALDNTRLLERALLNGAVNWNHYSDGGCSLIYDWQIAERLCTPSELKRTDNGNKRPNARESWLDVQARALYQACNIICTEFVRI